MIFVYLVLLSLLIIILALIKKEEDLYRKAIAQGIANKYWPIREKRKFVRFDDDIRIRYLINKDDSMYRHSKTTNISKGGICLVTYEKLKEKSNLNIELDVPNSSKSIEVKCQVVWTKNLQNTDSEGRRMFYVGVKFTKINSQNEALLTEHLIELASKGSHGPI